jgi:deoxyribose-phosphate aldolase
MRELAMAVRLLDLAALSDHETPESVRAAAARACRAQVAALCVHPQHVRIAREALRGSAVRLAAVAGGFPQGALTLRAKVEEIRRVVADGAQEVDVVIRASLVRDGEWRALDEELAAFREAGREATLKVILRTGVLPSLRAVARASEHALVAGADFIKTSTGRERVNATLRVGRVMARAIAAHAQATGRKAGLKPSGGIRTAEQALDWMRLVREELGDDALVPARFRIGASSLLDDLERRIAAEG